jgi:DnaJ-like protein
MSLQHEYNEMVSHLHMFCNGKRSPCQKCEGRGIKQLAEPISCTKCGGEGYEYMDEDGRMYREPCYRCGTTGWVSIDDCPHCEYGEVQAPCGGWILSDFDTIHRCPKHYDGQPEPEL